MNILALDPGTSETGMVVYDPTCHRPISHEILPNADVLAVLDKTEPCRVVIEMVACYGMSVGAEIYETCVWIGRYMQAWYARTGIVPERVTRVEIKKRLCFRTAGVTDAVIRQRLIDLFGPGKDTAIGKKASPGPLYGFRGDEWAALAVAVAASMDDVTEALKERT